MKKRSEWMEGLLAAEDDIKTGDVILDPVFMLCLLGGRIYQWLCRLYP